MLFFASDNTAGVHPAILHAIEVANIGDTPAYGADAHTESAIDKLRSAFECDAEIVFVFNGTGANVVAISSLARPHEAVLSAACAHLNNDECAAPERFFGGKIVPLPHCDGKIAPCSVARLLAPQRGVHRAPPRVLSITQPTEFGTLYQPQEIAELAAIAHENDMFLHMDGARLANAAAALNISLGDASHALGVDVLSFGGTKNGALAAEAVLFFEPTLATIAAYMQKQTMQLASKMRFVAAQFNALFEHELWLQNARHANAMAARLAAGIATTHAVELLCPVATNALFATLPSNAISRLQEQAQFYVWDAHENSVRWMTSYATTAVQVDAFVKLIRHACRDEC